MPIKLPIDSINTQIVGGSPENTRGQQFGVLIHFILSPVILNATFRFQNFHKLLRQFSQAPLKARVFPYGSKIKANLYYLNFDIVNFIKFIYIRFIIGQKKKYTFFTSHFKSHQVVMCLRIKPRIKPINNVLSQMKIAQNTFHISTTNSNVNQIMTALQDRNTQSQQAKIYGNVWSIDFNLSLQEK
ncbi:Hypothetical_protein [Hexamita inflata]|uniref:Hypothetical_protein n=1 Tax=Hexamita inflata TaxID=28002 RepID=A0AA86TH61_9EUKA|nr:Hypothetical protein HINF_LOCUS3677 [Hexamita inflata]